MGTPKEFELTFEEEPHVYRLGGKFIPAVSDVLDPLVSAYDNIPPAVLARARDIGHAVHAACALMCQKNLEWSTVDPKVLGYVQAAQKFLREADVRVLAVEYRMCDPELWVAGTLDLLGLMKSKTCVFDWKATEVMPRTAALQTAAYDHLYRRNIGGSRTRFNKRYGVQLFADSTYKLFPFDDERDYNWFKSALNLWHWRNR
jgi:hypothetical protein